MSAEIHCTTHPSPRPCASIYIRLHAGRDRSGSTDSQELRSCWSAGCPLLPSTYFHRLATKQLNVRNPETRSGLGTLALIQLVETQIQKWIWECLILLSCSPPAAQLQGQPGRSCSSRQPFSSLLPAGEGKGGLPGAGGVLGDFRSCPAAPSLSASPQKKGAGSRPRQRTQPRWAALVGQKHAPGHRGTLAEANARITPDTAGDFCYKYRRVSPVSLQPWSQIEDCSDGADSPARPLSLPALPRQPAQQRHRPPERKPLRRR